MVDSTPPAGAGLRWLHLLVLLMLVSAGVGAGQAAFVVHDLGRWGEVQACAVLNGLPPDGGQTARLLGQGDGYDRCAVDFEAARQLAKVVGAVAMPLLAGACLVAGAVWLRWRLGGRVRRRPPGDGATATVAAAFGSWCDTLGLTGHRRPRLVVAPVGQADREAYTTAVPLGRPVVVVPVAYAYGPREQLDLVILHELAHVRARDVSWAAATWWAGWIVLPVLALTMAPAFLRPSVVSGRYAAWLAVTAALAAATLVLRAVVLRRREHAADRFAVAVGGLRRALADATADDRPVRWSLRSLVPRLLAAHPANGDRVPALDRDERWEGGSAVAAAIGLLAMSGYQTFRLLTLGTDLPGGVDNDEAAMALAALCWAAAVVPVWARDPAATRQPWWARVLGSAVGLTAGYHLPPFGESTSIAGVFVDGFRLVAIVATALVVTGVSAFGAGLAEAVAAVPRGPRRAGATTVSVLGLAALLAAAVYTVGFLIIGHWAWRSVAIDRAMFVTPTSAYQRWLPVALAACVVLVAVVRLERRADARRLALLVLVAGCAGAVAGIVATQLLADGAVDDSTRFFLLLNRWWICAGTGWLVALAVLVRRGSRGAAMAWSAGAATVVLCGVAQFLRDVVAGTGRNGGHLLAFLERPGWLYCALVVVTFPAAVLAHDLVARRTSAPLPRKAFRLALASSAAGAVALACVVGLGWSGPATGEVGDWPRFANARVRPETPDGDREPVGDPGRPLTDQAVEAVLATARRGLPAEWATSHEAPGEQAPDVQPPTCAELFTANRRAERERAPTAAGTTVIAIPADTFPPLGATLRLSLISYPATSAGPAVLAEVTTSTQVCPDWTVSNALSDDRMLHLSIEALSPSPDLPHPNARTRVTESSTVLGLPAAGAAVNVLVSVGHNLAVARIEYARPYRDRLDADELDLLDEYAVVGARLIVHALGS